jgi:hypothetical protein
MGNFHFATKENEMTTKTHEIEITTRARAFAGRPIEDVRCRLDADGTVLVWDSLAGHYTRCHSLGDSAIRRIRRLAAKAAD